MHNARASEVLTPANGCGPHGWRRRRPDGADLITLLPDCFYYIVEGATPYEVEEMTPWSRE